MGTKDEFGISYSDFKKTMEKEQIFRPPTLFLASKLRANKEF